ncbi:MAG: nitroreductase family protein [Bacteroidales bacterium]|nr:nitroreductase family protein [Bacteroidales bacterium]
MGSLRTNICSRCPHQPCNRNRQCQISWRSTNGPTISGAIDAGYVSQNIDLACEALGLCTVPRATMDKEALKKELKLTDSQNPILNHPIGYKK